MGIAAILTAAMRHISWTQVADAALQYGPDIFRKLRGRLQPAPEAGEAQDTPEALQDERVRELERALVRQGEIIEEQNRQIAALEEAGKTLQARVNIFMAVAAVSALLSIISLVLLVRR
jgi:hypothetical protein